jgi:hypothetical protein
MPPRFKPGQPVLINGTLTNGIAGKIVMVITTVESPKEHSYIVEYFRHVNGEQWELLEREFQESMLLPLDPAVKLLYLD